MLVDSKTEHLNSLQLNFCFSILIFFHTCAEMYAEEIFVRFIFLPRAAVCERHWQRVLRCLRKCWHNRKFHRNVFHIILLLVCYIVCYHLSDMKWLNVLFIFVYFIQHGNCWTTEDMELFDLVENTPKNFYDVLGVDPVRKISCYLLLILRANVILFLSNSSLPNYLNIFIQISSLADIPNQLPHLKFTVKLTIY